MKLTWEKVNEWKGAAEELLRDDGHTQTAEFLHSLCEDWLEMYEEITATKAIIAKCRKSIARTLKEPKL
jgi:hypothetical protein